MNAADLRFFLAVREAGSIKGGARALRVDHSTVSRRIAALEEALQAKLFERTPEGLVETDVARAIVPLAERIEILAGELEDAAKAASGSPHGPVCIAVFPVLAVHFLIPRVPELRRRFPDVGFEIYADVAPVNVLKREADIAIRTYPEGREPAEPSALAVKVGKVGFALYGSKGYVERHGRPERPVRSLAGHELIAMGKAGPGSAWNAQLEEPAQCAISVYPGLAVTAALHADLGLGVRGGRGPAPRPRERRAGRSAVVGRDERRRAQQRARARSEGGARRDDARRGAAARRQRHDVSRIMFADWRAPTARRVRSRGEAVLESFA